MADSSFDPGIGFMEEGMAVEEDRMGQGALRFAIVGMSFLALLIFIVIEWATFEGHSASVANNEDTVAPAVRQAEAAAAQKLTRYDVVDATAGVFQIPIDRAIALEVASRNDTSE